MADIIVFIIVIAFSAWGVRRGLIKTLFGAASTLLSLLFSILLYEPISDMLYNSGFGDAIKEKVEMWMAERMGNAAFILQEQAVTAGTELVLNVISFIIVIISVKILVVVLAHIADLTSKFPIIKQANALLGMVAGAAGGLLVCYIIIGIIAALGSNSAFSGAVESLENSFLAINMYEGNVIAKFLSDFIA